MDLGYRLGLPAFTTEDGQPRYSGGYPDYIVNHERSPGIGPLAGWRGADGTDQGKGAPNPDQLQRYIENGCFWKHELPLEQQYFKHANRGYLEWAASVDRTSTRMNSSHSFAPRMPSFACKKKPQ